MKRMQRLEKPYEQRPTMADPQSPSTSTSTSTSNEHAHEHEHEHEHGHGHGHEHDDRRSYEAGPFAHEKLDVYRVALEMAVLAKELASEIPRGHRNVADHLQRAADGTVLLIAEGANRRGPAAAADLILLLELGSSMKANRMKQLAGRVCAMLTGLIAKFE